MIAGGLGGTTGDLLMHSLDTVKTRQQGDLSVPPRYPSMSSSYGTILRQEGLRRGLYGGWVPALLGSFPGTIIFFGTYEYSKRHMIDAGINPQFAYLSSGMIFSEAIVYDMLLTDFRVCCRLRSFFCICSFRSSQDSIATPRSIQQPLLPVRL